MQVGPQTEEASGMDRNGVKYMYTHTHSHGTHSYACTQVNCHGQYCTQLLFVNSELKRYTNIS